MQGSETEALMASCARTQDSVSLGTCGFDPDLRHPARLNEVATVPACHPGTLRRAGDGRVERRQARETVREKSAADRGRGRCCRRARTRRRVRRRYLEHDRFGRRFGAADLPERVEGRLAAAREQDQGAGVLPVVVAAAARRSLRRRVQRADRRSRPLVSHQVPVVRARASGWPSRGARGPSRAAGQPANTGLRQLDGRGWDGRSSLQPVLLAIRRGRSASGRRSRRCTRRTRVPTSGTCCMPGGRKALSTRSRST